MKGNFAVGFVMVGMLATTMLVGCVPTRKPSPDLGAEGRVVDERTGPRGTLAEQVAGQNPSEDGPLRDVHFDYDRYDLRSEDRGILQANAQWLRDNPRAKVEIEGHCDDRGTVEYNMALGAKRADSVKNYLVALGIPAGRFSTVSYGHELPLCHEANEECWARNRRGHSVVSQ